MLSWLYKKKMRESCAVHYPIAEVGLVSGINRASGFTPRSAPYFVFIDSLIRFR